MYAVIMKNKERELFIDALLKGGANPNLKTEKSKTALITLIDNGDDSIGIKDAIKILIDAGADPNLGDSDGSPPLFYAADLFNVEAVKALIDNGADVKSFLSIESDGTLIADLLFDKQPDDELDDEDKKSRQEVVELLKPYR
ncbi:Ankyrin repeat-containing protein [Succinivibrio dextrinosolvens]|uniref:Ankyrin repeat-containing protein n=2 Tax=Succinivibrio dextrinosolvens TaxID=83771 RepID=A0A662ZBE0_9GAMM|nr:Ankyrin repeat-containing protein [Succinivibrio dextrinosolvens]